MGDRAFGFSIALAIFIADQLTKWLVTGPLDLQSVRQIEVIPFFNLTWVENYGISLGLFEARSATGQWILIASRARSLSESLTGSAARGRAGTSRRWG
jgi:signal peptidase II